MKSLIFLLFLCFFNVVFAEQGCLREGENSREKGYLACCRGLSKKYSSPSGSQVKRVLGAQYSCVKTKKCLDEGEIYSMSDNPRLFCCGAMIAPAVGKKHEGVCTKPPFGANNNYTEGLKCYKKGEKVPWNVSVVFNTYDLQANVSKTCCEGLEQSETTGICELKAKPLMQIQVPSCIEIGGEIKELPRRPGSEIQPHTPGSKVGITISPHYPDASKEKNMEIGIHKTKKRYLGRCCGDLVPAFNSETQKSTCEVNKFKNLLLEESNIKGCYQVGEMTKKVITVKKMIGEESKRCPTVGISRCVGDVIVQCEGKMKCQNDDKYGTGMFNISCVESQCSNVYSCAADDTLSFGKESENIVRPLLYKMPNNEKNIKPVVRK